MTNILLLNVHSGQNAGDRAILEQTLALLHEAFVDPRITVAINDREYVDLPPGPRYVGSLMHWVLRVDAAGEWHWRKALALTYGPWLALAALAYALTGRQWLPRDFERRQLWRAYYAADVAVVIGGGHLYARRAFNISFVWLWLGIALAIIMRKPVIMLPQSYGPVPGRAQRAMLRWLIRRSALVTAREYTSVGLLAEVGGATSVLVLPDLAFRAADAPVAQLEAVLPQLIVLRSQPQPLIGLTLMDWGAQNPDFTHQARYEAAMIALIERLHEKYRANIVLFSQCTGPVAAQDDRHLARKIAAAVAAPTFVVEQPLAPDVLKAAYHQLDALVATRMHSAIFALSNAVPTLAIGYLHKSEGIMRALGLGRYVLDIRAVDAAMACAAFDRLWAERDATRQLLARRMPMVQATLAHLPQLIRSALR